MLLPRLPLPAGVGQGRRHPSLIPSPCAGQSVLYTSAGRQNRAKRKIRLPPKRVTDRQQALRTENENTKDMPPIKIYKFGGASVRSAEGVENLARIVAAEPARLLVIVSAMGKTTNALEEVLDRFMRNRSDKAIERFAEIERYHRQIVRSLFARSLFRRGTHRKTRLGGSGTASQRNLPGGLRSLVRPDRKLRRTALDRHRLGIPRRTRHAEPVARHARAFRDRQPLPRGDHQRRPVGSSSAPGRRRSPRTRTGRTGIHRARRRRPPDDARPRRIGLLGRHGPAICSMPGA